MDFQKGFDFSMSDDLKDFIITILFSVATSSITAFIFWFVKRLQQALDYLNAIGDGVKMTLRDRVYQAYKFHIKNGYCEFADLTHVDDLYKHYQALGGNGTVTKLMEDIHDLPSQKSD